MQVCDGDMFGELVSNGSAGGRVTSEGRMEGEKMDEGYRKKDWGQTLN